MELFWSIVINVIIGLAIFYLLIIIVDVGFVVSFRSIMKKHDHDISVILTNKKDNLTKLIPLLSEHGVKMDKKNVDNFTNFDLARINNQDNQQAKQARDELTLLSDYFLALCYEHSAVNESADFLFIDRTLKDIDRVYRQHILMYNADVLGYNYWINFFLTRYIYKIFRIKEKEII